jgi:hypothetical protein
MDSIKSLEGYFKDQFPDLLIRKPLFYNSKIGIRFEIGCPKIDYLDNNYIKFVYIRSIMLFQEIFFPDTDIFLVVNAHRWIEDNVDELQVKYILKEYLKNRDLYNKIDFIKLPYIYQEEDEEILITTYRYCLSCKVKDIDYKRLLQAIGNQDMGIEPSFKEEVFFINKDSNVIYNLYDDRGLDIVSNTASTLEKIYTEYNNWILDYDRKIIDQIFKKGN